MKIVSPAALLVLVTCSLTFAGNWPHWRGTNTDGISDESKLPTKWSATEHVAWKLKLPGPAGASPVVWEDKVFVSAVDGNDLILIAVSTDGKELWRQKISSGNQAIRGDEGNFASPSPVTDGSHVWCMMANGDIACFDFEGKEIWNRKLSETFGPFMNPFGMVSSPVLYGKALYLQLIHGNIRTPAADEARIVAVDKESGKDIWTHIRKSDAHTENKHSYASPMLYDDGQRKFLITHGADYATGIDLATGEEIWRLGGLNPQNDPQKRYHTTLRFVSSPAAAKGIIVVPTAKNGPVFAIKADAKGDITGDEKALLWKRETNTPDVPCPLIRDGLVYLCRENGNLVCMDAATGEEYYQERTHAMRHRASPVFADGNIYLSARDGKVSVVKAGKKFELLAQNDLGESLSASPAISNGTIYLRTFDHLWAIR
ncbi:MAG: PQQ-binding-like beta-propeller repeat protein [Planctomycetota bacterium]|nr:PQQ-binding-like beta-propeller repeat protein [Planctomycetota bacterium]MDA1139479.1 PQQ-binding-like beta-propeller repeat protein [Planctomycetota bacterium]